MYPVLSIPFSSTGNIRTKLSQLQHKRDRQCTYNVTMRHICATTVAGEKAMSVTQPECVHL